MQKGFLWVGATSLLALAVACGGGDQKPASPTSPTASAIATGANATGDTATLKVNGPTPTAPTGGQRLTTMEPVLTFAPATAKYVQGETFTYRVELLNGAGATIDWKTGKETSYTFKTALDANTAYSWRVRAELDGRVSAWSSNATFKTMERPTGYLRGNEVYDPLLDGKSIGKVTGATTFVPGVGLRLDNDDSSIEYRLQTPCTNCSFSMLVSGVGGGSGTDKSKIMTMREENGLDPGQRDFLVNNDRRMTVEKRGDGNVAWRFITHDDQVDTIGAERRPAGVRDEKTYLWSAIWNGSFTLRIQEWPAMNVVYDFGKRYGGVYDPNPHVAYAGSGTTFGGHGSVAGMVVRQVWLSPNPRPSWANQ